MVVAPSSTVDMETVDGSQIEIEQRDPGELYGVGGTRTVAEGIAAWNPVFDVTPGELIDAIVTERGVILIVDDTPDNLALLSDALDEVGYMVLVALDGLDEVAGNREDEIALFDFHNRARAAGVTVLYTAQKAPEELGLVLPDLRSRLGQCVRVLLQPLDEEGRAAVLRERALRRGLAIDEAREALTEAVRARHRLWAALCEDNSQADVARACGVLRQAVAQGVERVRTERMATE